MGTDMSKRGYTLIELMLMVVIISIMSAIAIPKALTCIRRAQEAKTKGNLNTLRSALAIYYGDMEGYYPTDRLQCLTKHGKYLSEIPTKYTPPYHPAGNTVGFGNTTGDADEDYLYDNDKTSYTWGKIIVNCLHRDLAGRSWSSY